MSRRRSTLVESITLDFVQKRIVFKMTSLPNGRQIENIHKILNLDERFQAINKRLSFQPRDEPTSEVLKMSTILRDIMLTDIDTERQEIVFHYRDIFDIFDVEQTGEQ